MRQLGPTYTMLLAKILSAMFHCTWNSLEPVSDVSSRAEVISVEVIRGEWESRGLAPISRVVSPTALTALFRKDRLRTLARPHKRETDLHWRRSLCHYKTLFKTGTAPQTAFCGKGRRWL